MKINELRGYIIIAIVFIVYSVISFAAPFKMLAVFWIAYIFGMIAIAYQIYIFRISFINGRDVKSKFYGFPIAKIGVIYLIIQLALSLTEMCFATFIPIWVAVIVNIIPIAVTAIGCIAAEAMRDEIICQDIQLKKDVSNMRALQSLSAALVGQCSEDSIKMELQKLADEFKYSDPVSSNSTKDIENELAVQMKELQKALIDGELESANILCSKIFTGLSERNRVCALNK